MRKRKVNDDETFSQSQASASASASVASSLPPLPSHLEHLQLQKKWCCTNSLFSKCSQVEVPNKSFSQNDAGCFDNEQICVNQCSLQPEITKGILQHLETPDLQEYRNALFYNDRFRNIKPTAAKERKDELLRYGLLQEMEINQNRELINIIQNQNNELKDKKEAIILLSFNICKNIGRQTVYNIVNLCFFYLLLPDPILPSEKTKYFLFRSGQILMDNMFGYCNDKIRTRWIESYDITFQDTLRRGMQSWIHKYANITIKAIKDFRFLIHNCWLLRNTKVYTITRLPWSKLPPNELVIYQSLWKNILFWKRLEIQFFNSYRLFLDEFISIRDNYNIWDSVFVSYMLPQLKIKFERRV